MRKLIFITFLLLFASRTFAPNHEAIVIFHSSPVSPFDKLIYAVGMVEGRCDTSAYNEFEEAAGYFQIRPIRLEDYNKRTGSTFVMKDMFNYEISEKIFLYYAGQIGPYNLEKIARNWNGSGPRTDEYWKQVRKFL